MADKRRQIPAASGACPAPFGHPGIAQSERVFSSAGQIVTEIRNRLSSENVELLVALKNIWSVVEEWQQSKATPV